MPDAEPGDTHADTNPREAWLFGALAKPGETGVRPSQIRRVIAAAGWRETDPHIAALARALDGRGSDAPLGLEDFDELARPARLALETAAARELVIPDFTAFADEVARIFESARGNHDGAVADYIPQLGRADPDRFALALCTTSGQRLALGDAHNDFCVQSVSKPVNYCIALEELGEDAVHKHMGCEPSGVGFNEIALDRNNLPHNPMINAGGIMSCALIKQGLPVADRFDHVASQWQRLTGGVKPGFSNATFLSERDTADRNYALGYSMRERRAFPPNTNLHETLEFYFQCCSLESTADHLAVAAATLAGGGVCPTTGDRVFSARTVQSCLSLMLSCGMYDYSGEWAFRVGLPAKSGVAGAVIAVVPGVMGLCAFSPRLDKLGNSVRATDFFRKLVAKYNFHVYDGLGGALDQKTDPTQDRPAAEHRLAAELCWAAREGDTDGIRRLVALGADPSAPEYDGRTPLHLAASEGRDDAVKALLDLGADPRAKDRWGDTPLDDAARARSGGAEALLTSAAGPAADS